MEQSASWLVHLTVGEASFDDFTHHPHNPVYTGSGDEAWPVNGFLFSHHTQAGATSSTARQPYSRHSVGGGDTLDPVNDPNRNQALYIGLYGSRPLGWRSLACTLSHITIAATRTHRQEPEPGWIALLCACTRLT